MEECLFCKIAAGEIPANKLYEDEQVLAFYDIHPQAKVHFLVIPKRLWATSSARPWACKICICLYRCCTQERSISDGRVFILQDRCVRDPVKQAL